MPLKGDNKDTDTPSEPEPIGQINQHEAQPNDSTEIKDSPAQSTPNDISGTSTRSNDHFEGISLSSFDDVQDGDIFDLESDAALDTFATKSDIMRIEMKQDTILANQKAILDHLSGISSLLNERAKKRGISPLVYKSNASCSSHFSESVTTTTVDTKGAKVILPSLLMDTRRQPTQRQIVPNRFSQFSLPPNPLL